MDFKHSISKIIDYKIISGTSTEQVEKDVLYYINEGYVPCNTGFQARPPLKEYDDDDYICSYFQVMVKYENST